MVYVGIWLSMLSYPSLMHLQKHREDFEPFIEDEVPFEQYCDSMLKDGTWAGHMELQAASLLTRRNICIHMVSLRCKSSFLNYFLILYRAHIVQSKTPCPIWIVLLILPWMLCASY